MTINLRTLCANHCTVPSIVFFLTKWWKHPAFYTLISQNVAKHSGLVGKFTFGKFENNHRRAHVLPYGFYRREIILAHCIFVFALRVENISKRPKNSPLLHNASMRNCPSSTYGRNFVKGKKPFCSLTNGYINLIVRETFRKFWEIVWSVSHRKSWFSENVAYCLSLPRAPVRPFQTPSSRSWYLLSTDHSYHPFPLWWVRCLWASCQKYIF